MRWPRANLAARCRRPCGTWRGSLSTTIANELNRTSTRKTQMSSTPEPHLLSETDLSDLSDLRTFRYRTVFFDAASPSSRVSSWSDVFFCLFVFSFFFCPLKVERYRHAEPMARLRFGEANAILAVGSVAYLTCKFDYAVPLPFPWKSSPGGGRGWDCVSSSPSAAKKKERQRSLGWLHQPTDQGNRPRWLTVASKAIGFRSTQTRLATAASDRSLNDTLHDLIERVDLQQVLSYETRGIISRHGR